MSVRSHHSHLVVITCKKVRFTRVELAISLVFVGPKLKSETSIIIDNQIIGNLLVGSLLFIF